MKIIKEFSKLGKYALAGFTGLLFDLAILFALVEFLEINYLFAVAFAFVFGICLNYSINFFWGFRDSKRKFLVGHEYFVGFGIVALFLTVVFMKIFVDYFGINYLFSRIIIGAVVGIFSFLANSVFTFKTIAVRKG